METRTKSKLLLASFSVCGKSVSLNQVTQASLGECEDQKTNDQTRVRYKDKCTAAAMPNNLCAVSRNYKAKRTHSTCSLTSTQKMNKCNKVLKTDSFYGEGTMDTEW